MTRGKGPLAAEGRGKLFRRPRHTQIRAFITLQHQPLGLLCQQWFQSSTIAFNLIFTVFPRGSGSTVSTYNAADPGSIPGSGRSPGEGNGNPLQYSGLENPMDRGAWQATVHRVTKSRTRLSDFTNVTNHLYNL